MSKGLGKLQRDILAHLDAPTVSSRGVPTDGWTTVYGTEVVLAEGVYDLRNVKFQVWREVYKPAPMTIRRGRPCAPYIPDPDSVFIISFSQAVRSLVERGVLESLRSVPVCHVGQSYGRAQRAQFCGQHVMWYEPERRFVRLKMVEFGG